MPWTTPQSRPVGYVIKKVDDWDVIIGDLQYLKNVLDGTETQTVTFGTAMRVYPSGGVYIGSNLVDPGPNKLIVQGRLLCAPLWVNGGATENSTGGWITWNVREPTNNRMEFINHRGTLPGGFSFWGTNNNTNFRALLFINDNNGNDPEIAFGGSGYTTTLTLYGSSGTYRRILIDSSDVLRITKPGGVGDTILATIDSSGLVKVGADLLITHRHPYSGQRHIESGSFSGQSIANGASYTQSVTFTKSFSSAPVVVVSPIVTSGSNKGVTACISTAPSTSGFAFQIINNSGASITAGGYWIAEGPD